MKERICTVILTALLVLLMAGAAVANGNGCVDSYPVIGYIEFDDEITAGNLFEFEVEVSDADGCENVTSVTANFSEFGIANLVEMEFFECIDADTSLWIGNITLTKSTCTMEDNLHPHWHWHWHWYCVHELECDDWDVIIIATDGTGLTDIEDFGVLVEPADPRRLDVTGPESKFEFPCEWDCIKMEQKMCCWDDAAWWCKSNGWENCREFPNYVGYLNVLILDEYGNIITDDECYRDLYVTNNGTVNMVHSGHCCWDDRCHQCCNKIWVIDEIAETVEFTVFYRNNGEIDTGVSPGTCVVDYVNLVGALDVTFDPEFLIADECDETVVTAQLVDVSGNPIAIEGVSVIFSLSSYDMVNLDTSDNVTDADGKAYTILESTNSYATSIFVYAAAECKSDYGVLEIREPTLHSINISVDTPVNCSNEQQITYTCYNEHGNPMDCPDCHPCDPACIIWNATGPGTINETGYFTALDSGTAIVEVNVSGVIETAEIVINCTPNCAEIPDGCICSPHPFEIASGSVTLSGNFTETGCEITGWACVEAIGNPIDWTNDTRGAIVNVSEDRTEDVMLNLSGEGDTWKYNETTGNWSKYANGSISEVSNGTYALVTPGVDPDPCEGVTCEALTCVGVDRYNMTCEDGSCVAYMLIEANCVGCGYEPDPTPTPTVRRSSGGSGGTYPPGWGSSTSTGSSESTENATVVDPTPDDPTPADVKPTVNLPGDTTLDTTPDETEDDAPGGADPTNAILVVLGILALLVIGYVLYRKSQNGE